MSNYKLTSKLILLQSVSLVVRSANDEYADFEQELYFEKKQENLSISRVSSSLSGAQGSPTVSPAPQKTTDTAQIDGQKGWLHLAISKFFSI